MKKNPAKTEKQQSKDTRFKRGQSGNPAGRPQGSRHKTTLAVQALLDGEAEMLTRKCIEKALEGDLTALRLCLDRIIPVVKERPIMLDIPDTDTAEGIDQANEVVLGAVSNGKLTPTEGAALSNILKERRVTLETIEIDQRLTVLEEKAKKNGR